VGQRIWIGSPYRADIEIFDMEGRFVARLQPGVDGIAPQDMDSVHTQNDYMSLLRKKFFHTGILPMGDLVLAFFSRNMREHVVSIFDTEGTLLRANLKLGKGLPGVGAEVFDNQMVRPLRAGDLRPEILAEKLGEEGLKLLYDNGFKGPDDDAVYLIISQIRKPPSP
jgi:hypothetical protein